MSKAVLKTKINNKANTSKYQHLLCPTDFSKDSGNGLKVAATIAEKSGAHITVFHAYKIPFVDEYMPGTMVDTIMKENAEKAEADMRNFLELSNIDTSNITIETRMGFTAETIAATAEELGADLIVMSTQGCNSVEDRMFGTVTWNTIKHSEIPVLAIPHGKQIPEKSNIIFPFECNEEDIDVLTQCLDFAKLFSGTVQAIHFLQDGTVANKNIINKINTTFRKEIADGILHLNFVVDKNITDAITRFAHTHNAGAIVMVTHHSGLMATIFHMSITRQIALYNNTPLLAYNSNK
ncbi:MAG: universal stress protein [Chitinophagales bacterium]